MNWTSLISAWWLLPVAVVCFLGARFLYQKKGWLVDLDKKYRAILIALRTFVLLSLVLLLFGIVFEYKKYRDEKPMLIHVIDNSKSAKNYKDSAQVESNVAKLSSAIANELSEKYSIVTMPLHETGKKIQFSGETTNLSSHIESLRNLYVNKNIGAFLLTTDGNYNEGSSPLYTAEGFNFVPFYTLGIGDTIYKRDQLIRDVISNEYAYLNNSFPVEVEIEGRKVKGLNTFVELYEGNRLIEKKSIRFEEDFSFKQVSFQLNAAKIGVQRYTVKLPNADREYNLKNNKRDFYITVLESRNKIVLLTEAPHPDIAAIKATLESNENIEVVSTLQSKWDKNLTNLDLVVWHEPGNNPNLSVFNLLKQKSIPIWFIVGPNSNSSDFIKNELSISSPNTSQNDELQPSLNSNFEEFSVSEELIAFFKNVPPLNARYGKFILPPSTSIFLNQRIGPIEKQDALQFFYPKNGTKYGVLLGEGIWKWRLNDYVKNESFAHFDEWVNKTTQYLINKENRSPFVVQMPARFTKNEEVIINAEVYNGAMELTNKEAVSFNLKDRKGQLKKFSFAKTDKAYRLYLGKLKSGLYSWTASTNRAGKKLTKNGSFVVNDINLEDLDNEANHTLLRQLAQKTKGDFAKVGDYAKIIEALKKREDITTVSFAESSFLELIDWKFFFWILLLAFTAEWFLRKWWGGY